MKFLNPSFNFYELADTMAWADRQAETNMPPMISKYGYIIIGIF